MIPLDNYLLLSAILFVISFAGIIINRKNLVVLLMCIEILFLAVNTNFVAFAQYLNLGVGELFVFFILTVAAAESAIGLAIMVLLYRQRQTINVDVISTLKG